MTKDDLFPVPKDEASAGTPPAARKKPGPPKGSPQAKASGAKGRRTQQAREIAEEISAAAGGLGAIAIPFAPLPGGYLVKTADELGDIVGRLAAGNPKLLAALQKSSATMDYLSLAVWSAGLVAAAAVQVGRLPVDGTVSRHFEIDAINDEFLREAPPEIPREEDDGPDRSGDDGLPRPDFLDGPPVETPERLATG